jgi:hypothetical protein
MQIMVTKAQLKIQQMAFMLIAVTVFFILVGMFVLVFKFSGVRETATALQEENAMLLVTKLANSPEFACGESFGTSRTNCIDADKAMVLKENIETYKDFWNVANIEIRKIYPETGETLCTIGNYPDCNIIRLREEQGGINLANFVSLCRKEYFEGDSYDKCEVAKLMVSYENE